MIAGFMETFNGIISRQEAIGLHGKLFFIYLHHEWSTEIENIGIADIGKLGIGESLRKLVPQLSKFCFPEEINEQPECLWRRHTVVIIIKMISIE